MDSISPIIALTDLPRGRTSAELIGADHGGLPLSMIVIEAAPPGTTVRLHRHDYPELFFVQAGEATFRLGDDTVVVRAGEIVIAPAGVPHGFTATGDEPLHQIDIHASPRFVTEYLED
ncbi:MAG: cupin domain-containing protein [Solirubrobacteraceae bacterium]